MRDIRVWVLAVVMGAVLGLAGGFAASFATSQGGRISPGEAVPSSETGLLPSPSSSPGGEFTSESYQFGSGGSGGVRGSYEDSGSSSLSTSSSTSLSTVGEGLNISSSVASVGQGALGPAAGQNTTAVQWARDVVSTVQLFGDVNHDGMVDVEDLALVGQAFGTALLEFDLNGDGVVDHDDLDVVVRNLVR